MNHDLKILPAFFSAIAEGNKRFEIRNNKDRGFQRGDTVTFREILPSIISINYTGNKALALITYVSDYNQRPNQVVFGFDNVQILKAFK